MLKNFIHHVPNITTGTVVDLPLPNGGILLSARLQWLPYTFYNKGTDGETTASGSIHALVHDKLTSASVIGQWSIGANDPIIVASNDEWVWENPEIGQLRNMNIIHKLLPNTAFSIQPAGIMTGDLRFVLSYDPVTTVAHGVMIEAEVLAFDTNLS